MFKTIGCCRFTYNWALNRCNELYEQKVSYSMSNIRQEFTQLKKDENFKFLNEVSNTSMVESMRNLDGAFKTFFKTKKGYPKFKTKKKSRQSFYVRYDAIKLKDGKVNIEKIGKVIYSTNYDLSNVKKFTNPYCNFDGKYWCLSFGFEHDENQVILNKELSVGIDLGIKDLAIVSCIDEPIKNINKTKKVRKLKKKLKRMQRQIARKYEANKDGKKYIKTSNIKKLERKQKILYRQLSNIRLSHTHQATNKIIKLKPYRVVMEDLNVRGMMKNRHLAKAIQEQNWYEFIRQMQYKAKFNGIEFVQVGRFYPSSRTCSCCGNIKKDLRLKDRIYKCKKCGLEIDRDKNASFNLACYGLV